MRNYFSGSSASFLLVLRKCSSHARTGSASRTLALARSPATAISASPKRRGAHLPAKGEFYSCRIELSTVNRVCGESTSVAAQWDGRSRHLALARAGLTAIRRIASNGRLHEERV
jgi:hypothetical protein